MTLEEMKDLYTKTTECGHRKTLSSSLLTVRLYDGMDNTWIDIAACVELQEALEIWCDRTKNGTENTKYADIDYYSIFPASSRMIHSDDVPMDER